MIVFLKILPNWLLKSLVSIKLRSILLTFLLFSLAALFWHQNFELFSDKPVVKVSRTEIVMIDPGHGGADPGAVVGEITEADLNMRLSEAIKKKLERAGIEVRLTRQDNTGLVPDKKMSYFERWLILEKRKQFAELSKADILISIHTNSNEDKRVSGAMVYFSDPWSKPLAEEILRHILKPGAKFRKVYPSSFNVIKNNKIPSVLVEAGFITNEKDRSRLLTNRDEIAEDITRGIVGFLRTQDGLDNHADLNG